MTTFYRFETQEQFIAAVGTSEAEFVKDGIAYSVIGRIPDGGNEPLLDEDGTPVLDEAGQPVEQPTFKSGWHVNTSAPVDGWEDMVVVPSKPMRVFG